MIVQTDPRHPCVVLIGPPGAGKSTIGRKLARELGVELYDTDAGIEDETGRTIPEIFADDGEPEFRRIEERVVRRAVLNHKGVVSLGGGAVLSGATRELLRERTVVYLEISVAEGLRRTGANSNRPLLAGDDPGAKYRRLMRERRPLYREVASVRVRTDGRSPGRVVRNILAKLGLEPAEPTPAPAHSSDTPSPSRRSRSRRRRRSRSATAGAESPGQSPTPDSPAAEPSADDTPESKPTAPQSDSTVDPPPGAKRRSRRSRRGGRRRSRGNGTAGAPTPGAPTPGATASPVASPPAPSDHTRHTPDAPHPSAPGTHPSRRRRTARRSSGAPGLLPDPVAPQPLPNPSQTSAPVSTPNTTSTTSATDRGTTTTHPTANQATTTTTPPPTEAAIHRDTTTAHHTAETATDRGTATARPATEATTGRGAATARPATEATADRGAAGTPPSAEHRGTEPVMSRRRGRRSASRAAGPPRGGGLGSGGRSSVSEKP
ncbi:hypothetical protein NWFMUON74_30010 [Nocardia wallacei]|uniref:Shikimate kinase n=1 Tax=Nocardia wallacei TaxID=480035 RepID=A0A7G1KMN0_9NOCA|nr:hypothetical protein NWFMUON74_30010 [Nocardia wallacei]